MCYSSSQLLSIISILDFCYTAIDEYYIAIVIDIALLP